MSLERIVRTLVDCGIRRVDAEVYVFLAKKGPHELNDLAVALKLTKLQLSHILKRLQKQHMIKSTVEKSLKFSALPLEKILDSLIEAKIEQAQDLKQTKEEYTRSDDR